MITQGDLENWFTYHAPSEADQLKFKAIRAAAHAFAKVLLENTPPSADQTVAVRHVRDAVMSANSAIACGGR